MILSSHHKDVFVVITNTLEINEKLECLRKEKEVINKNKMEILELKKYNNQN